MKILNLYACIGGNRCFWGEKHEITAVEINPEIAECYQKYFPADRVVVGDAHQYLFDHYNEFDFIWLSHPCPTHSRTNTMLNPAGHVDMESSILKTKLNPMSFLMVLFGHITQMPDIKSNSVCKKYAMFLRWMVRRNSSVDIGIWESISPSAFIVPVDTHVMESSKELGLINKNKKTITYKDAIVLTYIGNEIFPNDPACLDFALYGYGIDKK